MQDQSESIKVLVADKSSYARLVLEDIINSEEGFSIGGLAADGDELVRLLKTSKADVVVADCNLPKNKHFFSFKRIFSEVPTPIVMLVNKSQLTLELVKQATELGVYAIILKPTSSPYVNYRSMAAELVAKVRAVKQTEHWDVQRRIQALQLEVEKKTGQQQRKSPTADTVIVIGASTGGTHAVENIVRQLAPDLKAAILVAVHLPARFTGSFARRLQQLTPLRIIEGKEGLALKAGKIIIAPGGRNMVVQAVMCNPAHLKIGFTDEAGPAYDQPSVDLLMQSVAESAVPNIVGILLTGMGKDGTRGIGCMQQRGGLTLAQDESSSVIFGMAKSAIESGHIEKVLPLAEIPHFINRLLGSTTSVQLAV